MKIASRMTRISSSARALACALMLFVVSSCGLGPMNVDEVYYLAASNGKDTNYFRIKVRAATALGVAEFRQGWFPANAVDALFGDVTAEGEGRAVLTREKLRTQIDEALVKAQERYLTAVLDTAADKKLRQQNIDLSLDAIARVRQVPNDDQFTRRRARVIQYNPLKGLVTTHSDEKLVWVLASDPDDIMTKIAGFAEDQNTQAAVLKFTDIIVQSRRNEQAGRAAANTVARGSDQLIVAQIDVALSSLEATPTAINGVAQAQTLLQLLRALRQGRTP